MIDRRGFLRIGTTSAASLATAALAGGCATPHPGAPPAVDGETAFAHGVASGDPLTDRVVLWTRVSPRADGGWAPIATEWWVARDEAGREVVRSGSTLARADRDFTIKLDVDGLAPGTTYHYGFRVAGTDDRSRVGRTRTLPGDDVARVRLGLASCSNYPYGHFNGYAHLATRDELDAVLHLGDYLYEYAEGEYGKGADLGRVADPLHEIVTLEDYRRRHATYKRDAALAAAHARHPWITVWDDHESANDSYATGAQNHQPEREGDWETRRLAAIRAYYEWMPIRELPTGLFRRFRFGELVDLVMLDTRLHGRDPRPERTAEAANDPMRTLLGRDQTRWLLDALDASKAAGTRWRVVGQQVVFAPSSWGETSFNPDAWDGYRANRAQILDHVVRESIDNLVFLTGDVHSSWVFDIPPDAETRVDARGDGAGSVAVEFVVPAISSPPLGSSEKLREQVAASAPGIPHLAYHEVRSNGYVLLDIDAARVRAEYVYSAPTDRASAEARCAAGFEVRSGTAHAARVDRECGD